MPCSIGYGVENGEQGAETIFRPLPVTIHRCPLLFCLNAELFPKRLRRISFDDADVGSPLFAVFADASSRALSMVCANDLLSAMMFML
jgi:hypothetical protein